jgi:hypothetical protein
MARRGMAMIGCLAQKKRIEGEEVDMVNMKLFRNRERQEGVELSPEQNLWVYVIFRAVKDIIYYWENKNAKLTSKENSNFLLDYHTACLLIFPKGPEWRRHSNWVFDNAKKNRETLQAWARGYIENHGGVV